ncbi:hypothetical protein ACFWAY_26265 [Rhodococcus sp. NPDC059968]|uniref:hypothetical protein n=1 Tax=Rhodococcus sp. NPDC059968 TaxID=3347017 RepID=UPI00366F665D
MRFARRTPLLRGILEKIERALAGTRGRSDDAHAGHHAGRWVIAVQVLGLDDFALRRRTGTAPCYLT